MKKTLLVCDRHKKDVPAVGTWELNLEVNGHHVRPTRRRDLCMECGEKMLVFFTPAKRAAKKNAVASLDKVEAKRTADRDRWRAKHGHKQTHFTTPDTHPRNPGYWPFMEARVMEAMDKLGEKVHIKDVMQLTELTESTTYNTLRRLIEQNKITTTGGTGRYRRYSIPAQE